MSGIILDKSFLSLATLLFVALYIGISLYFIRRKPSAMWILVVIVIILGSAVYWDAYRASGAYDWLPRSILSVFGSISLFLFNELSNSGNLATVFYGGDGMSPEQILAARERLVFLQGLFLCAMWTTSIVVIHFFARRLRSRLWLLIHRPSTEHNHIFLGADSYSLSLASDLSRNKDNQIIFIDFPDNEDNSSRLSVSQFFKGFKNREDRKQMILSAVPFATVLFAKTDLKKSEGRDLLKSIGLPRLHRWMDHPQSKVYLLSGDQEDIDTLLTLLPSLKSDLYIHCDRSGLNSRVELSSKGNLHFLDEALLTEKQLKLTPELYPVHFVERALDSDGEPMGWVKSPFNAIILGYGKVGQSVLSFLYEYASFVGEDKSPLPLSFEVLDQDATRLGGDFRVQHPGISEDCVCFRDLDVGTEAFWSYFNDKVTSVNYIAVDLGADELNAQIALDIIEVISRHKMQATPAIVVKLEDKERFGSLFDFYSNSLGMDSLFLLGSHDEIWTASNLFNDYIEPFAKRFHHSYCLATGSDETWESRREAIWKKDVSELWKRQEYIRKNDLDSGNYLHGKEKAILVPKRFIEDAGIADSIPSVYDGEHCIGLSEKDSSILEYLAIGEHIHWMAALHIRGYRLGTDKREDIKEHSYLVDYFSLSEAVRHYDWIIIKTTLSILREEGQSL